IPRFPDEKLRSSTVALGTGVAMATSVVRLLDRWLPLAARAPVEVAPDEIRWQRRGRTADLPIFRSRDNSSPSHVNVRNLHRRIDPNADERGRTHANETKDETIRARLVAETFARGSEAP
ncbi:MAG: hypothetical protein QOD59_1098, partial [Mycobacterium sp.]|nr:hypothetical protein [Mycobacterium sp.]